MRRAEFERPTRVGVSRKENRIIVFAVFGKKFRISIARSLVLETPVETSVIFENADDKPNPHEEHEHGANKMHCERTVKRKFCIKGRGVVSRKSEAYRRNDCQHATYDTCPPCVRKTADGSVRCKDELLGDGFKPDFAKFVRHIVVILGFVFRARKSRPDFVCGVFNHFIGFFAVFSQLFSHNLLRFII